MLSYALLFISAFGAATLLPLQSKRAGLEALVGHCFCAWEILGSCVNWWLGFQIEYYKDKKMVSCLRANVESTENLSKIWLLVVTLELGTDYW